MKRKQKFARTTSAVFKRTPAAVPKADFVEKAYLARYPDVAAAVKEGTFPSGAVHFEKFGRDEGRSPN